MFAIAQTLIRQHIVRRLDAVGMYRVVSGGLAVLAVCSVLLGGAGLVVYSPLVQLLALGSGVALALLLNFAIARVRRLPANHESAVITALILFFLTIPAERFLDNWPLWAAIAVAIVSKFLLTYRKQHIVNPAALGAVALSLPGFYEFSWWVATPWLFVPLVLTGAAVVHKVRRWGMVLVFVGVALAVYMLESVVVYALPAWQSFEIFWLSWPTLFLAFFMLTEPFTMPPSAAQQKSYGALVGGLSNTTLFLPLFTMSPELALVIGNIYAYCFRVRRKLILPLVEKREVAKDTWEFVFKKPKGFTFKAGQYLEWMLPHAGPDSRGPRRYFTIASAPSERVLRVACKFVEEGSSYKAKLAQLTPGSKVIASQLSGDFTLPRSQHEKLGFIAGGIGVTPFVSHLKEMQHGGQAHDVALYYCCNTTAELAYGEWFMQVAGSEALPHFTYHEVIAKEDVASPRATGYITADLLAQRTPDYAERLWYISGPPPMVNAYKALLSKAGVPKKRIKTDFFPGLA